MFVVLFNIIYVEKWNNEYLDMYMVVIFIWLYGWIVYMVVSWNFCLVGMFVCDLR